MTSVNLQNNVRLRIFLILVLSIGVRFARSFSSDSVHKASGILEANYVLYGITMILTLVPFKAAWMIAILCVGVSASLGIFSVGLGIISTTRCVSGVQTGCVQHTPANIATITLAGIIALLDIFQVWSIYLILRFPTFFALFTQRIRIIFSWAWPFSWMIHIALFMESEWTVWVLPHLFIDPTIILLATIDETYILLVFMCVAAASDAIALLVVQLEIARLGLWISLALTLAGITMIFASSEPRSNVRTNPTSTNVTPTVNVPIASATPVRAPTMRKRQKSPAAKISF